MAGGQDLLYDDKLCCVDAGTRDREMLRDVDHGALENFSRTQFQAHTASP